MSCAGCLVVDKTLLSPFPTLQREVPGHAHTSAPTCTHALPVHTCTPVPVQSPRAQFGTPGPTSQQCSDPVPAFCGVIFHFNHYCRSMPGLTWFS